MLVVILTLQKLLYYSVENSPFAFSNIINPWRKSLNRNTNSGQRSYYPRSYFQSVKNQDYLRFPDSQSSALYLTKLLPTEACLVFPFLNKYHHSIQIEIKKAELLLIMCYEEKKRRKEANFLLKILCATFYVTSFNPHNT